MRFRQAKYNCSITYQILITHVSQSGKKNIMQTEFLKQIYLHT